MTGTLPLGWAYLPVALVLGALHALEPGHGKSLASAYLVGGRHTRTDALILGVATTMSHTSVVLVLAAASLWLKAWLLPDQLERGIAVTGALILIGLGAWTVVDGIRGIRHGHSHAHGHSHDRAPGRGAQGHRGVFLVGLSNGVLPCPGALAALLVAISTGKTALGLMTVLTYSLGLALALAFIGMVVVEAGRRAKTWIPSDRALLWLPLASGILVLGTGVGLMVSRWV